MAGRRWLVGSIAVALPAVFLAGCGSGHPHGGANAVAPGVGLPAVPSRVAHGLVPGTTGGEGSGSTVSHSGTASRFAPARSPSAGKAPATQSVDSASGQAATRIVKTGNLSLTVGRGKVGATMDRLTAIATADGGYVESSQADGTGTASSGTMTLRVPTARFGTALAAARQLGRVTSVSTSADDVTGKYVDLTARRTALLRTRSTYLTILSRANTIGATLAVQQRVDDVQQQIDQLAGELKLLRNQSNDATLTVDLVTAVVAAHRPPPQRTGLSAAWHRSWRGFLDGVEAIVGALGPIVLALILVALALLVGRAGYRRVRRALASS